MSDFETLRRDMIEHQLQARGLRDQAVIDAMMAVPRERFVPPELVEFAYEDNPLPIAAGQTISQPYIVALMAAALELRPTDRVLEVGTGSGYAAAVLAQITAEVYTIERHAELAESARAALAEIGCDNVRVRQGDGSSGWSEAAPFDAIVVAAASPEDVPESLRAQLAVGGRLVIPAGATRSHQRLYRFVRERDGRLTREDLGGVRFVPLIGSEGWQDSGAARGATRGAAPAQDEPLEHLVARCCEPFERSDDADLSGLLARIGESRLVLIGEASHGTAEFYDLRARITRELIERKGFTVVAVEADWPDAAHIDRLVRPGGSRPTDAAPFARFPTWMWANRSVEAFARWLRDFNAGSDAAHHVGFYGLDLYSLQTSITSVLTYLEDVDPDAADVARRRYGCLTPYHDSPASYGRMALTGGYEQCERAVVVMLEDLLRKRLEYSLADGQRFFDAAQNARLVASAERYYRTMYYGSRESWNLRDQHMFDTLGDILTFHDAAAGGTAGNGSSKAVVWAHNSHLGDARATEMSASGEHNLGQLVRERYGEAAYLIGMGTDHGSVAAASQWGGPMEIKTVRPALAGSYEALCHATSHAGFLLPLREGGDARLRSALAEPRLERAIGVIYRPETERQSHYFQADLTRQFDEFIWLDETRAVVALDVAAADAAADTFPFGL